MLVFLTGVPSSAEETLTVGATAVGVTANLCGTGNVGGAVFQVLDESVYASFDSPTKTPDSGDFLLPAGTIIVLAPARMARFIRVTTDARVKVQATE
jgi:hypothetical protein